MKVVKFKGGLGNQLFQYVFMKALALQDSTHPIKADFLIYHHVRNDNVHVPRILDLNVNIEYATDADLQVVRKFKQRGNPKGYLSKFITACEIILNRAYYFERDRRHRELSTLYPFGYLDGYWQSWRHVQGLENELKKELTLKREMSPKSLEMIAKIKQTNAVFIGVRRGDYLATPANIKRYGSFGMDYYSSAIAYIKAREDNPVFYIFSDDIDWVKHNLQFDGDVVYREKEEQTSDTEELLIMASCQHAIIVNSTFQWWGAWLISHPSKIVIAPQKWFADGGLVDIVPDSWVTL